MNCRTHILLPLLLVGCVNADVGDTGAVDEVNSEPDGFSVASDDAVSWYIRRSAAEQLALDELFFEVSGLAGVALDSADHRTAMRTLEDGLVEIVGIEEALTFPVLSPRQQRQLSARKRPASPSGVIIDHGRASDEPGDGTIPPYVTVGTTRSDTSVEWCIKTSTSDLSSTSQENAIAAAMEEWALYTPVTFTYSSSCSGADLKVRFDTNSHGDSDSFDGQGTFNVQVKIVNGVPVLTYKRYNVLAHAYFPNTFYGERICFDDYETWTTSGTSGIDLESVAVHEVGHWLGLDHSSDTSTVMDEEYNGVLQDLQDDDIDGIQSLYPPDDCDDSWEDARYVFTYTGLAALYSGIAENVDSSAAPVDDLWDDAHTLGQQVEDDGYDAAVDGIYSTAASDLLSDALYTIATINDAQDESAATSVSSSARTWLNLADGMGDQARASAQDAYLHAAYCLI